MQLLTPPQFSYLRTPAGEKIEGYAEIICFFKQIHYEEVLARVVWFYPVFDYLGAIAKDSIFGYPLYSRELLDKGDRPALVPVLAIKQSVFLAHSCSLNGDSPCRSVNGQVSHNYDNTQYTLCPTGAGR